MLNESEVRNSDFDRRIYPGKPPEAKKCHVRSREMAVKLEDRFNASRTKTSLVNCPMPVGLPSEHPMGWKPLRDYGIWGTIQISAAATRSAIASRGGAEQ